MEFEKIEISRAENCPVCGSKPSGSPMPLRERLITELCGRRGNRVFLISPSKNLKLKMDVLYSLIERDGFEIKVKGDIGLTFNNGPDNSVSILKSGIMIIEGAKDEKEAYDFYCKIMIGKLRVPRSSIELEKGRP